MRKLFYPLFLYLFHQYAAARHTKKKKKSRSDFIIDEAEVDDDVDEDEEAWDDAEADGDLKDEAEEAGRTARDIEARMREQKRHGGMGFDDGMDADEIEQYYRDR